MNPERWQRVKELFEAALKRGPEERTAFLAQVCAGDKEIWQEVESLLAAHEGDLSFMNTPVGDLLVGDKPMLAAGEHFGPYEEISPLGEGGMGQVYLAVDTRLGRKVALKLLPSSYTGDADRVRRFGQEARAASALNHPNIITIYEIGQMDGRHFIAAEHIAGETLRARLERGRLQAGEALDIAVQVASALASAHEAGIVHRDIKPENIMLRRDRIVKVLDFGLAKLAPHPALATDPASAGKINGQDEPGRGHGDGAVHVAGTGLRAGSRSPHGHLFIRCAALRAAYGEAGIWGRVGRRDDERDLERRAGGAHQTVQQNPTSTCAHRAALSGEKAGATVSIRE